MAHPREVIRGVKLMVGRFGGASLPPFEIGLGNKFVPCIDGETLALLVV